MRKYPTGEQVVEAVYNNTPADNPLLAALPEMLSRDEFMTAIRSLPPLPHTLPQMSSEERRQSLPLLSTVFVAMDYMYVIYDQIYRAICTTYTTRTVIEGIRQTNRLFQNGKGTNYATQADTGSILGVPGIGKTSTIQRCLSLIPQVIEHIENREQPFYCKQVLYLRIECPSDCSIKTLAFNLLAALDQAVGSNYLEHLTLMRSISVSAIATQAKILCATHHVGLIIIDEIQNVVLTARKNRQVKPLIRFMVEMTNDTGTAVYFVGTPEAEELFVSQEHLKRRTRGIRLLPLRPDGTYRSFLEQLWLYQFTAKTAPLTDKIANKMYDYSAGIPAYIVRIFREAQSQALLTGAGCISEKLIQQAVDILAIRVPRTFSGGTYLSDFSFAEEREDISTETTCLADCPQLNSESKNLPRLFANKRGRPVTMRDDADLLLTYKTGANLLEHLQSHDLLEVFAGC